MDRHVTLLGTLHIACGVIGVCIGLFLFWLFVGPGLLSGEPTAIGVLTLIGAVIGGFVAVTSIPHLFVGYGLLKRTSWARIVALIVGAVSLIDIPFGTILGIYTLWVMLKDETALIFQPAAR